MCVCVFLVVTSLVREREKQNKRGKKQENHKKKPEVCVISVGLNCTTANYRLLLVARTTADLRLIDATRHAEGRVNQCTAHAKGSGGVALKAECKSCAKVDSNTHTQQNKTKQNKKNKSQF